jgi:serine/threonine protein phosphatase PrpC
VCACDGIWDVMDDQQALDFITLGKSMKEYQA